MPFYALQSAALRVFHGECSLPGRWQRIGDDFSGCVIEVAAVSNLSGTLKGTLMICPARMKEFGWMVNDQKWKPIERVATNTWKIGDLHKAWDPNRRCVLEWHYVEARLFFINPDTIIVNTGPHYQKWQRVSQ